MKGTITTLRGWLASHKLTKQYEKVEAAIKRKAELMGDLASHNHLQNFYTERVLEIDPHAGPAEAWDFAAAKQKQYDHQLECVRLEGKIEEAHAKVVAAKLHFHELQRAE